MVFYCGFEILKSLNEKQINELDYELTVYGLAHFVGKIGDA